MGSIHKSQKISIFILVIMLIAGMCFDAFRTDSCSHFAPGAAFSRCHSGQVQELREDSPHTPEMLESRSGNILEHVFSRITNSGRNVWKPVYSLCPNIFLLPRKGFYSHYSVILSYSKILDKSVIKYLHKSDGKKQPSTSF